MSLTEKKPTVRIESFRDTEEQKARILNIQKTTKASYSDVMRHLIGRGLDDYEGGKVKDLQKALLALHRSVNDWPMLVADP